MLVRGRSAFFRLATRLLRLQSTCEGNSLRSCSLHKPQPVAIRLQIRLPGADQVWTLYYECRNYHRRTDESRLEALRKRRLKRYFSLDRFDHLSRFTMGTLVCYRCCQVSHCSSTAKNVSQIENYDALMAVTPLTTLSTSTEHVAMGGELEVNH